MFFICCQGNTFSWFFLQNVTGVCRMYCGTDAITALLSVLYCKNIFVSSMKKIAVVL